MGHNKSTHQQTNLPSKFIDRFSANGEAVAAALPTLSLDVIGIICSYALNGFASVGAEAAFLYSFNVDHTGGSSKIFGLATCHVNRTIWACDFHRVRVFDYDGQHLFDVAEDVAPEPACIAIANGEVFITCCNKHFVAVCDLQGKKLRELGERGEGRDGKGGLCRPWAVAVHKGLVYVSNDDSSAKCQVLTREGKLCCQICERGSETNQFLRPSCIAVTDTEVFMLDYWNYRLQVFSLKGKYLRTISGQGTKPGQLSCPDSLALDRHGHVYIADRYNAVQVFVAASGEFVTKIGAEHTSLDNIMPHSVCLDHEGRILVGTDVGTVRVFAFVL